MSDAPIMQVDTRKTALVAGDRGLMLRSMDEMWRFAVAVDKSGLAPAQFKTPESILIAVQMGFELGLSPMTALRSISVINNRPTLWGDAMLALCQTSPDFDHDGFEEVEEDNEAVCRCKRKSSRKVVERRFSMADAKTAGLAGKQGPWTQYPRRMMQLRARSWALRDTFPDVLQGIVAAEEARDFVDVQVTEVTPAEQPKSGVDRVKDKLRAKKDAQAAPTTVEESQGEGHGVKSKPEPETPESQNAPPPAEAPIPPDAQDIAFKDLAEMSNGRYRFAATFKSSRAGRKCQVLTIFDGPHKEKLVSISDGKGTELPEWFTAGCKAVFVVDAVDGEFELVAVEKPA